MKKLEGISKKVIKELKNGGISKNKFDEILDGVNDKERQIYLNLIEGRVEIWKDWDVPKEKIKSSIDDFEEACKIRVKNMRKEWLDKKEPLKIKMTDREKLIEILNNLDAVNHPYEGGEIAQVAESCFNDLYEYLEIEKQNK